MFFIILLVFIDLLFIVTGQMCSTDDCTMSSIIFNAILGVGEITLTTLFTELIGDVLNKLTSLTGILSIGVGTGRILLIPMTLSLALIASDFVTIGGILIELNLILGTFIIAPIMIGYILSVIDFFRGQN